MVDPNETGVIPDTTESITSKTPSTKRARTSTEKAQTKADLEREVKNLEQRLAAAEETNSRLRDTLESFDQERMAILSVRDYAIGTEQELGKARFEIFQRDTLINELRLEIIDTHARLAASIAEAQDLHQKLQTSSPYRKVRHSVGSALKKAGLK